MRLRRLTKIFIFIFVIGSLSFIVWMSSATQKIDAEDPQSLIAEPILEPHENEEAKNNQTLNYNAHIFYYVWYGTPEFDNGTYLHWNHEYLPHWNPVEAQKWPKGKHSPPEDIGANFYPSLGCYSSRDKKVIDQHFRWIRSTGVGTVIVSWYPKGLSDTQGKSWDDLMPLIFDSAEKFQLKISFHIEPWPKRGINELKDAISYIIETYSNHPAFYFHKFHGERKPLFYIYDSYLIHESDWKALLQRKGVLSIRNTNLDAFFIGLLVKESDRSRLIAENFDGFYTYFAAEGFSYGSTSAHWKYLQSFARRASKIFIPSVGPGYIDERIRPWNKANIRARHNGKYYEDSWNAAINSGAKIISVTSFNEWHEGTQIEPAIAKEINSGYRYMDYEPEGPMHYLKMTNDFVVQFSQKN